MLTPAARACAMRPLESLQGHVRGFATSKEGRDILLEYGLPETAIFTRGCGVEDLDPCLSTFRGRPGWLILAQDLRAFGPTKRAVAGRADALERAGIRILDISHPEDTTYSALLQRAQKAISGARFQDRRRAKRQGRRGGQAKGLRAHETRDGIAPRWVIDRIVDDTRIPWEVKVDLLAPHFSESTLRRHYGAKNTSRGAA
jgi:hypothetical protein